MIGSWLPLYTINQSQLTRVHANSPRSTETKNKVVVVVVISELSTILSIVYVGERRHTLVYCEHF